MRRAKIGRIGVLMGGASSERGISLKSGQAVYQALREQNLEVVLLDIDSKNRIEQKVKKARISLAFIALHGEFGEDGAIQKVLESLRIPYTGSGIIASYLCLDKVASRAVFKHYGLRVPEYAILNRKRWKTRLEELKLEFPVVVKPSRQGSSIGVSFVDKRDKLKDALSLAFEYDETVMVERYIKGREITVGILEEQFLPVIEIVPKKRFFDFQAKYETGKSEYIVPAKLMQEDYQKAQDIGLLAHQALDCRDFSRVDMILAKAQGPVFVLEVNSIPGLTSTSLLPMAAKAQGIDFGKLCLKIVRAALKRRP